MSEVGEDYKAAFKGVAWLVVAFGIAAMCLLLGIGGCAFLADAGMAKRRAAEKPTLPLKGGGE